ncbi:MAG: endonuclease/exonuclease/phosphatase family protein [Bacteroidia bacterium]|nr:endonuclease/exonuclease/phosphatase family protein [Bacteroidia bacterium]
MKSYSLKHSTPLKLQLQLLFLPLLLLQQSPQCRSQQVVSDSQPMTVLTWNIRNNNPGDGINAWPNRKEKVFAFIRKVNPQIIGMQEVLAGQMKDLAKSLPKYSWFGVGRDDGREAGEYVPVFYDKSRFRFLKGDHFWLSETPGKPGKPAWDAACTRMVTWVCMADLLLKDTLFVFNTHFDHIGVKARLMSAQILTHAVDSLTGNHAVIITGDFNSSDKDTPHEVIIEAGFKDSRAASITSPVGPVYTFTGFDITGKPGERIDFIYVKNTKPVQNYIVRDDSSNGFYLSDHLPVMVTY